MPVLRNIGSLARCLPAGAQDEIHAIRQAALAWDGGIIRWVGPEADLPASYQDWPS
jgi:imidazolonepropionase